PSVNIQRLFFLVLLSAASWSGAHAQGWVAVVPQQSSLPAQFLGIDKSKQEFFYFERFSPMRVVHNFSCSTGQVEGDKFKEGDLRTPEGIYFLERKLDSGLNYDLYGDLAFTLNFPNPVDRIRGKSGYGIWIHGRGTPIVPRETQGCVALNNADLHTITPRIKQRMTPVAIAREMKVGGRDSTIEKNFPLLEEKVKKWIRAWEQKSPHYFSMYDKEKFALSTGIPFEHFAARKERLFQAYPWIKVLVRDIRILPGPGYWVTYFGQYFVSPTFRSEGIKRLYWQIDESDELKIVGSEWVSADIGLKEQFLNDLKKDVGNWLEEWRQAWLLADEEKYVSFYSQKAVQDGIHGVDRIIEHKKEIWTRGLPQEIVFGELHLSINPEGIIVSFHQRYFSENGYQDEGMKKLVLEPAGDEFRILKEIWRAG
ncbi:MAG: L,D-transpeptidase family protein, partial [Desulfovibrionales bacterium]